MVKKLLLIVLIISFLSAPVFAASDIHSWYVDTWIKDMNSDREAWNPATVIAYIKAMVDNGFITKGDILKEFGDGRTEVSPFPSATPTQSPLKPSDTYAALKILPDYGYHITEAGGHIYSIDTEYDDAEQSFTYVLEEDNKPVYYFDEYWGPRGVVQVNGAIYVATTDAVYKYSNNALKRLTGALPGYVMRLISNGKDMYVVLDDDNPDWDGRYFEGDYYKVSTSGTLTKLKGETSAVDYEYKGFSVNKDGDRLSRVPIDDSGTVVRNLSTGKEYFQRLAEENEAYAKDKTYTPNGEFAVENTLYYGNCLLVNVKGSLVYYDDRNKAHVILGDMKGSRLYRESYRCQPDGFSIATGLGDKVRLGYVITWTIGSDGYIYGVTMKDTETEYAFKLALPDSVKKVSTYKKAK